MISISSINSNSFSGEKRNVLDLRILLRFVRVKIIVRIAKIPKNVMKILKTINRFHFYSQAQLQTILGWIPKKSLITFHRRRHYLRVLQKMMMMYFWKIQEKIFANEIRNNFSITSSAMNVVTHVHRIKTNRMIDKICDEYIEVDYLVHQISFNSFFSDVRIWNNKNHFLHIHQIL